LIHQNLNEERAAKKAKLAQEHVQLPLLVNEQHLHPAIVVPELVVQPPAITVPAQPLPPAPVAWVQGVEEYQKAPHRCPGYPYDAKTMLHCFEENGVAYEYSNMSKNPIGI
jgi:phenolic acid decarboxylase